MKRRVAAPAVLLALSLGCTVAPVPLHAGAPEKPVTEHVFMYPVQEVLGVTSEVLIERQYPVKRDDAEHKLLTDWRWIGQAYDPELDQATRGGGTFHLRRYYVEGQSLGPQLSVLRVFRVEHHEEKPWKRGELSLIHI